MTSIGYATLDVIPSFKGLASELEKGSSGPLRDAGVRGGTQFGDAAGKAGGSRFGAVFKRVAQASLVGVAALGAGAVKLAMDSVSAASDLEESTNKVAQIFGGAADEIFRYSEKAADGLGQTNEQARSAAATFGIFGSAAGLADKKNARFAKRMTTLASDLASFNNTDPSQAVEALGAALRGESEPIRAYGVMLDDATLKAEALALGLLEPVKDEAKIKSYQVSVMEGQKKYNEALDEFGPKSLEVLKAQANLGTAQTRLQKATEGTIPALTNQQKMLAAQSQIFKQTKTAQGDFARTSDGLANQQRRLAARFEDAKARLGTGLLPIMTQAADFLLDKGIPAFESFADWFNEKGIPALKKFGGKVETTAGFIKDLVDGVSELSGAGKIGSGLGLLAGGIVVKHKLAGIFDRGGIGNPMFVTVTNPGGLPDGTGGKSGGIFNTLTKAIIPYAVAAAVNEKFPKAMPFGDEGWLPGAPKEGEGWLSWFQDEPEKKVDKVKKSFEGLTSSANLFGDELDLVGNKKVDPSLTIVGMPKGRRELQLFIGAAIEARQPIQPYVQLTGYDRAMAMIRTLKTEIHSIPSAGVDNGVTYASGGGTSSGITIDQRGSTIVAHDYNDFVKQTQKKSQQAGLGGRPVQ